MVDCLAVSIVIRFQTKSFENHQMTVISGGIIYRLHPTKKNGLNTGDFFREFSEFVEKLLVTVLSV